MRMDPTGRLSQKIQALISAKSLPPPKQQAGFVHYLKSDLSESDLTGSDITVLITGVKYLLQHWDDACNAEKTETSWADLCFYLAGWLCAAVKCFGDSAALEKTIRNLQFVVSKCSKTPQVKGLEPVYPY